MKTWCEENCILRLEWPSNAADLNPIENVWALWKDEVRLEGVKTADELWRAASGAWQNIQRDPDIVNSLIDSMPRRLQEVIDKNGFYTSY